MKIEELISKLEKIRKEEGNIDVVYEDYDEYSGTIDYKEPELEIKFGEIKNSKFIFKENKSIIILTY